AGPGARTFIATGGTTPGPAYDRLSRRPLDWASITVVPTDERFVDPASDESNERLLRTHLLVDAAAASRLVPLKAHGATPDDDAAAVEPKLAALLPSACVLLGMGADGHIGSLFPGDPDLAARLDPEGGRLCVGVAMASEKPHVPRISLTVRAFLATRLIMVLISGAEKRRVIDQIAADPAYPPPVAAILRQDRTPVRILWAP
ncbi:MAG: 6-phosphogluconolactonase, partial [Caulobacteraceae bacterium]